MRKLLTLSFVLLLPCWGLAQDGERQPTTVVGIVKGVDAKARTLTLEGRKRDGGRVDPDQTYPVAEAAKLILNGVQKDLKDIAPGTQLLLTLSDDGKTIRAALIAKARPAGEGRRQTVTGTVSKVDGKTITIFRRGDNEEKAWVITLDAATKVRVETNEDTVVKGDGGTERKVPRTKEGTAADIQVGKQVQVNVGEMNRASQVTVLRAEGRKG